MSFPHTASNIWPKAHWTGQSSIHVSMHKGRHYDGDSKRQQLRAAYEDNYALKLLSWYRARLPDLDWLVQPEEFEAICYSDLALHAQGKHDISLPTKLKNPTTGNVFNRVALYPGVLVGIRFWFEGAHENIWARLRIAPIQEQEASAREKAAQQAKEAQATMVQVLSYIEIAEPASETAEPVKIAEPIAIQIKGLE